MRAVSNRPGILQEAMTEASENLDPADEGAGLAVEPAIAASEVKQTSHASSLGLSQPSSRNPFARFLTLCLRDPSKSLLECS